MAISAHLIKQVEIEIQIKTFTCMNDSLSQMLNRIYIGTLITVSRIAMYTNMFRAFTARWGCN
jgi:hypothetical protein